MKHREHLRDAAPSRTTTALQALAANAFAHSSSLRSRIRNAGQVADFIDWQSSRLGSVRVHMSRERLWSVMATRMNGDAAYWHGIEFGVAWGYATDWWLRRARTTTLASWDGFDRFTGMPRAWREHDVGAFDAGGRPPAIDDSRVKWHIGDVEKTVHELDVEKVSAGRRLVLFDLDIYEPTAVAWQAVEPLLKAGDLIYFDEAMDHDERRVLNEMVLPSRRFEYVGCSALALALAVA